MVEFHWKESNFRTYLNTEQLLLYNPASLQQEQNLEYEKRIYEMDKFDEYSISNECLQIQ
jgi:hypothetical protein